MSRKIYGESVQGASHIRSGVICQDSYKQVQVSDDVALITVADGHGSASCPHSRLARKLRPMCSAVSWKICFTISQKIWISL